MRNYAEEISSILSEKNFSYRTYLSETLRNLVEILSDEKKEQLLRVILSIREYKSPRPYSVIDDELGDEHDVFVDEAEMIMQIFGYGFSRFDFLAEFLDGLTKDEKDAFRVFLISLQVEEYY